MGDTTWQYAKGTGIVLGLAALFTWFGVYGTEGPLWIRIGLWVVTIGVGALSSVLVVPWAFEGPFKTRPVVVKGLVATSVISLPVTAALLAIMAASGDMPGPGGWPRQYGLVWVVTAIITAVGYLVSRYRSLSQEIATTEPNGSASAAEAFLDRLPLKYRGAQLYAVSSEDHYLRVHTDRGEELILMRLADAVRELSGADGLQTHRSWWVAANGVDEAQRTNGKLLLVLKSGVKAPVSRTYTGAVRAAGWV